MLLGRGDFTARLCQFACGTNTSAVAGAGAACAFHKNLSSISKSSTLSQPKYLLMACFSSFDFWSPVAADKQASFWIEERDRFSKHLFGRIQQERRKESSFCYLIQLSPTSTILDWVYLYGEDLDSWQLVRGREEDL